MKSRIGWLVLFYARQKIKYESILGRGVYGRELAALLNETDYVSPGYSFNPISINNIPVPYEVEMNLSNASDCQDYLWEGYGE